jgi:hypothetical protein
MYLLLSFPDRHVGGGGQFGLGLVIRHTAPKAAGSLLAQLLCQPQNLRRKFLPPLFRHVLIEGKRPAYGG